MCVCECVGVDVCAGGRHPATLTAHTLPPTHTRTPLPTPLPTPPPSPHPTALRTPNRPPHTPHPVRGFNCEELASPPPRTHTHPTPPRHPQCAASTAESWPPAGGLQSWRLSCARRCWGSRPLPFTRLAATWGALVRVLCAWCVCVRERERVRACVPRAPSERAPPNPRPPHPSCGRAAQVKGNPTEYYRRAGRGSSIGAGIKVRARVGSGVRGAACPLPTTLHTQARSAPPPPRTPPSSRARVPTHAPHTHPSLLPRRLGRCAPRLCATTTLGAGTFTSTMASASERLGPRARVVRARAPRGRGRRRQRAALHQTAPAPEPPFLLLLLLAARSLWHQIRLHARAVWLCWRERARAEGWGGGARAGGVWETMASGGGRGGGGGD